MYTEHTVFESIAKNKKIWRYIDFTKFVSLLDSKALYFSNVDKLNDPYEGRYTKANIDEFKQLSKKDNTKNNAFETILGLTENSLIRKLRECTVINCWHINSDESAAMWSLYLKSNEGVAIQSRFQKLCKCFEPANEMIHIGKVRYMDYNKDFINFDNTYRTYICKRKCFEHEKELRAFHQNLVIDSKQKRVNLNKSILKNGKFIPVDINELIEKVYVSPTAPIWFKDLVISILKKYYVNVPVIYSKLYSYNDKEFA
ncbi:MAG: hypothetical protein U9P73_01500 [Candidatus Cloacimonadota bacterium]|nr:hypothetical protein [Candidatus Cloacimonadota bacterium]